MVDILPFKRTSQLISEIDEFIDKVSEASMVAEKTLLNYLETRNEDDLDERVEQIRAIEDRADELRRNVVNVMYDQMLMPDTRGDVLNLLGEVDSALDTCVHLVVALAIERPPLIDYLVDGAKAMVGDTTKAMDALLRGARAYFKEPGTVRDHVQKVNFHEKETTTIALRAGKAIFDSDMPLEQKRHLTDWLARIRELAAHASDVGDELAVFAIKRTE